MRHSAHVAVAVILGLVVCPPSLRGAEQAPNGNAPEAPAPASTRTAKRDSNRLDREISQLKAAHSAGDYHRVCEHHQTICAIRESNGLQVGSAEWTRSHLWHCAMLLKAQRFDEAFEVARRIAFEDESRRAQLAIIQCLLSNEALSLLPGGSPHIELYDDGGLGFFIDKSGMRWFRNGIPAFEDMDLILVRSASYHNGLMYLMAAIRRLNDGADVTTDSAVAVRDFQRAIDLLEQAVETKQKKSSGALLSLLETLAPISKRNVQEAYGQVYFHHALACTLARDFEAAWQSMRKLRERAPRWGLADSMPVDQESRYSERYDEVCKFIERGLERQPTSTKNSGATHSLASDLESAANKFVNLRRYPETVISVMGACVLWEPHWEANPGDLYIGVAPPKRKVASEQFKDELLAGAAYALTNDTVPSGDGLFCVPIAKALLDAIKHREKNWRLFETTAAFEARCSRYDSALSALARYITVLYSEFDVRNSGVLSSAPLEQFLQGYLEQQDRSHNRLQPQLQGWLAKYLDYGVSDPEILRKRVQEQNRDSIQKAPSRVDFLGIGIAHLNLDLKSQNSLQPYVYVRDRDWTERERAVLQRLGFPSFVVQYSTPDVIERRKDAFFLKKEKELLKPAESPR